MAVTMFGLVDAASVAGSVSPGIQVKTIMCVFRTWAVAVVLPVGSPIDRPRASGAGGATCAPAIPW